MRTKMKFGIALFAGLALIGFGNALIYFFNPFEMRALDLNTPTAHEIAQVLQTAQQIEIQLACDSASDVNQLQAVMMDTADAELDSATRSNIARVFGVTRAQHAGYLTAMQAYYLTLRGNFSAAQNFASPQITPTPKPTVYCPTLLRAPHIELKALWLGDERARVQYDDGAALQEAILVKRNGQWFIVAVKLLQIHF